MSSYDSISTTTKDFITQLNKLLRDTGHYIDFTNGILYSLKDGYVSAIEDSREHIFLIEEDTGDVLYESETDD